MVMCMVQVIKVEQRGSVILLTNVTNLLCGDE
jgi:hypothetical protein